jgi:hypothetical protein
MSLHDIFGDHPGRPDVPEFWQMSEVLLSNDAEAEEFGEEGFRKMVEKHVPLDVLTYIAMQRALALLVRGVGPGPATDMALWCDGFVAGATYATRYPEKDPS